MNVQKRIQPIRKYILLALASALNLAAPASAQTKERNTNTSQTEKYRLVWFEDPTTKATFVWNQLAGDPATLHYGLTDQERQKGKYSNRAKVNHVVKYDGMTNCFVRLQNLVPNSWYFMCLGDDFGVSRRFYFKTAPDKPEAFTFICGGDSRNFRDVRQAANTPCKKLAPLFVPFPGHTTSQDNA